VFLLVEGKKMKIGLVLKNQTALNDIYLLIFNNDLTNISEQYQGTIDRLHHDSNTS
jgi:hypothetical protein